MASTVRVLIAADHEVVREGLRTLLMEQPEIEVVGEAVNGVEAVKMGADLKPDVILMDLVMPTMDGIAATRELREIAPDTNVVVLTSFSEDQRVPEAIQAGAIGYHMKDVLQTDLLDAIHSAARGEPALHPEAQRQLMRQVTTPPPTSLLDTLTNRETDVLKLLVAGQTNKEIAGTLHLTEGTVKGYVSSILSKLEVHDRVQAVLYAVKHGVK